MINARHYNYSLFLRLCRKMGWELDVNLALEGLSYRGYASASVMVCRGRPELGMSAIDVFRPGEVACVDSLNRRVVFGGYPSEGEFAAFVDSACSAWLHCLYGNVWRPFKSAVGGTVGGPFPYRSEPEMRLTLEAKGY